MYCIKCGFKLPDNSRFCSNCGTPLSFPMATGDESIVSEPMETKSAMEKIPTEIQADLEPGEKVSLEPLGIEFDIVDHHLSFNADMVAFNKLRKPFSVNAGKHKAEYIKFYDSKVHSFDDLFQIAYPEMKRRIDLSVEFGIRVLMDYGVDHIDEDTLRSLAGDNIDPDVVMQPLMESAEEIQRHAANISRGRDIERSSRSKWYGGGFGLKGAVKGAVNAKILNIATDTIRGIGDSQVDAQDRAEIENMKKAVFTDPDTRQNLLYGVYQCCFNVFVGVHYVLAKENLVPTFSFDDLKKINARINNYVHLLKSDSSIRPQFIDILCEGLQYCPYRPLFYVLLNMAAEEKHDTILPVAQYFGVESRYIEDLVDSDIPELDQIKKMPEGTEAEIERKVTKLEKLNRRDPFVGAGEILAPLQKKIAWNQHKISLVDSIAIAQENKEWIDTAISENDLDFLWSEIDKGNSYAEYALEMYYEHMCSQAYADYNETQLDNILDDARRESAKHGDGSKLFGEYLYAMLRIHMYAKDRRNTSRAADYRRDVVQIASQGNISAMTWAAIWKARNTIEGITDDVAMAYLQKAADAQHPWALKTLGGWYMNGDCGLSVDKTRADELLNLAKVYGIISEIEMRNYESIMNKRPDGLNTSVRPILTRDVAETERIAKICFQKISGRFSPNRIFITKNIPAKKFAKAQEKYIIGMGADEIPVLLADTTLLGSGKEGCLLTNKALYLRETPGKPLRIPIEDIINLRYSKDSAIVVSKHKAEKNILISMMSADGVRNEMAAQAFSQLINDILDS